MKPVPRTCLVLSLLAACALAPAAQVQAAMFNVGDVFAAIGDNRVRHYSATGTLIETLNLGLLLTGADRTTGMAFDAASNLYVTAFDHNTIVRFDKNGSLLGQFGGPYGVQPESIVFDKLGNYYVSSVGASGIKMYSPSGALLKTVIAGTRVDWMDLAADQTTMLYTQEGGAIKRVNVATGTGLTDFATANEAFALRILPDGSVLLANGGNVRHYNALGSVIKTYTEPGTSILFALNLDPDGTSFWTGDIGNGKIFKIDIATGALLEEIDTGVPNQQPARALAGLAIFGENTQGSGSGAAVPEPATATLLALGFAGLLVARRWRRTGDPAQATEP